MKIRLCHQRWPWIRSAGVDSSRILRFSFGPGSGVKNLWKTGPGVKSLWKSGNGSGVSFQFQQRHESVWSFLK